MDANLLAALGLSQEELQERVIERIAESALSEITWDYEDEEQSHRKSRLRNQLDAEVKRRLDEALNALCSIVVQPIIEARVNTLVMQKTDQWGAAKGEPVSFTEYCAQSAKDYLDAKVDAKGRAHGEYGYEHKHNNQSRIVFLVNQQIGVQIHRGVESAVADVHKTVTDGLVKTVQIALTEKLGELQAKLQKEQLK